MPRISIDRARCEIAKRYLRYSTAPLSEIAGRMGFDSPSGFSLFFNGFQECPRSVPERESVITISFESSGRSPEATSRERRLSLLPELVRQRGTRRRKDKLPEGILALKLPGQVRVTCQTSAKGASLPS